MTSEAPASGLARPADGLRVVGPAAGLGEAEALLRARPLAHGPRRRVVSRERLVRRLAKATDVPLVLLAAPAGYGKTAVLAEWEQRDPRPFAWVSAVDSDNDPAHLLPAIVRALHEVEALPNDVLASLGAPGPDLVASALPRLVLALERPRRPSVLVVDDAHNAPAAAEILGVLADHLAPGFSVAVASRTEPALPIGRLRAQEAVVELRAGELRMDDQEAALLLRGMGMDLPSGDVRALVDRTEGWPAGLHLAALSLGEQDEVETALESFAGDDRFVADYIRDELLSSLAPDELAFLVATSPLDRLSGLLCDAILQRRGSGRMLHHLARSDLMLVPLDRGEAHFRHHRLVAETLRAELRRADPGRERVVHRRASGWYEDRGDVERAIDHAVAAADGHRAGELLWRVAGTFAMDGRAARLDAWLNAFSEEDVAGRPELALVAATSSLVRGDRDAAERWTEAARWHIDRAPPARQRRFTAAAAVLRGAVCRDGVAQMGRAAQRAYSLAPPGAAWRSLACFLEGAARHLHGDRVHARVRLEEGARRSAASAPIVHALCLAQLALLALERQDRQGAMALADRGRAHVESAHLGDELLSSLAFAASAFARAQCGRAEEARSDVADARRLLARPAELAPWFDAEARFALARAELRLSDAAAARSLLVTAARAMEGEPDVLAVHGWIGDAWGRADDFAAAAVAAPSPMTIAELRVLRFLPSHLSVREIAARLHVSANTVKTQAHAVYGKLDVSSRSDAVARARSVGLIDG